MATVAAKLLLGWMSRKDAIASLNQCEFDEPITEKKAIKLWQKYRDRVDALEPRDPTPPAVQELTPEERQDADAHIGRINAGPHAVYQPQIIKIDPRCLVARQFHVITERSDEKYGPHVNDPQRCRNFFMGVGLDFNGQLVPQRVNSKKIVVDLPHDEFVPRVMPDGSIDFKERDRYVVAIRGNNRMVLWAGYHRTYAFLRHGAPDGAGVAPLLTVMTGIPEVEEFIAGRAFPAAHAKVFGERPPLLVDFLDDELCISVNFQKKRFQGQIVEMRPGQHRVSIERIDDE